MTDGKTLIDAVDSETFTSDPGAGIECGKVDAPELKPCPFCGGEAYHTVGKTGDGKPWHYVECTECGASGPNVDYAWHNIAVVEANAEAWNTRADLSKAAVEALEAKLEKAVALLRRADQQVVWESLGLGNTFAEEVEAMIAELTGGKDD